MLGRIAQFFVPAAVIAAHSGAPAQESVQATPVPVCTMSEGDRAWIDRALEAWRFASREISGIGRVPRCRAFFFDAGCLLTSDDALTSPTAEGVTWNAAPHTGTITTPDGKTVPAGVTSFAAGEPDLRYFVMSTPSVWEANGVGKGRDLETTMVCVLLHEGSHVAQLGPYGSRLGALVQRSEDPESFSDDVIEDRFKGDREFAAAVERESQLFLQAAAAAEDTEAKLLAYEARELMRERHARWFAGDDAYLVEADHVWLTFEGSAQWVAYQWLVHPRGGAQAPADPMRRFMRGSWSQTQGFALVMALDRIVGPDWKRHAFGDGEKTVIEMLDAALAN